MNLVKRALTGCLMLAMAIPVLFYETASACTSLALKAEDGAIVYGRTMEWGAFDLNSRVSIFPVDIGLQATPRMESQDINGKPNMVLLVLMPLKRTLLQMA